MLAQAPSSERFTALFRAEYRYVWGGLRRLGVGEGDAEDVAHEVFLRVYDKLANLDPARPTRPWLFAFVYRAASDYKKLARHRGIALEEDHAPTDARSAEDALSAKDTTRLVQDALDTIDLERRTVLVAFEMDDIPMKEIAAAMDIPLFTAYSRLRLAREDFRAAMARLSRKRGIA
jgi:RNA polymerase sigma-70 factor (ECF subfamily)